MPDCVLVAGDTKGSETWSMTSRRPRCAHVIVTKEMTAVMAGGFGEGGESATTLESSFLLANLNSPGPRLISTWLIWSAVQKQSNEKFRKIKCNEIKK